MWLFRTAGMSEPLESLPDRPLRQQEVTALNHADAFSLVVPVDRQRAVEADTRDPVVVTEHVILGTDDWVTALTYDSGWVTVETVPIEDPDSERFEAMQECEAALTAHQQ